MLKLLDFVLVSGLLSLIMASCWAAPVGTEATEELEPMEDYLEDDMLVGFLRNGQFAVPKSWPNATVYYKISPDFDISQATNIRAAMSAIEAVTCVRFYEANETTVAYINIKAEQKGCVSRVGYQGRPQRLNLQKTAVQCFRIPIIMHELLHSLGFFHEHMAPERDDYISVMWENIKPDKAMWFRKLDNKTFVNFGFGYDYDSVMHYGRKGFSANGLDTILPLDSNAVIGQRLGLSAIDIGKINAMYNCTIDTNMQAL